MTEGQKGNTYIVIEMIIWSLFPIVSLLGLKGIASIVSLFWVNLFAALFFFLMVVFRGKLFELKNKKAWFYTLGVVFFINIIFYGLFFFALAKTTPANAAIVGLFEIIPSYLFFQIIRKEQFKKSHLLGIFFALVGTLIVLLPKAGKINTGDIIILVAVFFPPIGNWCQQQSRKLISSESALFLRHLISIPFLYLLAIIFSTPVGNYNISSIIGWLLLNGIVIFGLSKILWVESIHRMSVTRALAVNSLNPAFTVLFAWFLLHQVPTYVQLLSLPFLIASILVLTNFKFNRKSSVAEKKLS